MHSLMDQVVTPYRLKVEADRLDEQDTRKLILEDEPVKRDEFLTYILKPSK